MTSLYAVAKPQELQPKPKRSVASKLKDGVPILPQLTIRQTLTEISASSPEIERALSQNSLVAELYKEAQVAFKAARKAYERDPKKKIKTIKIHSGRRDTAHQMALYQKYLNHLYGGPVASPANKPGASFHELGLAIDVVISPDRISIKKHLNDAGWDDNQEGEPWHFELSAIAGSSAVSNFVSKMKEGDSTKLAKLISDKLAIKKAQKAAVSKETSLLAQAKAIRAELVQDRNRVQKLKSKISKDAEKLTQVFEKQESLRNSLHRLLKEFDRLSYSLCPNGRNFSSCGHKNLKAKFTNQKNKLSRQADATAAKIETLISQAATQKGRLDAERRQFKFLNAVLKKEIEQLRAQLAELKMHRERLKKHETKLKIIDRDIPKKLAKIQKSVLDFIATS